MIECHLYKAMLSDNASIIPLRKYPIVGVLSEAAVAQAKIMKKATKEEQEEEDKQAKAFAERVAAGKLANEARKKKRAEEAAAKKKAEEPAKFEPQASLEKST